MPACSFASVLAVTVALRHFREIVVSSVPMAR